MSNAIQYQMKADSRKVTNPVTKAEEQLSYEYPEASNLHEAIALCGSEEQVVKIVNSRNKARISSYFTDARTKTITTEEDWQKHKQNALTALRDTDAPLASTRGTGNSAKAKAFDNLQASLQTASTPEEVMALLKAQGFLLDT